MTLKKKVKIRKLELMTIYSKTSNFDILGIVLPACCICFGYSTALEGEKVILGPNSYQ